MSIEDIKNNLRVCKFDIGSGEHISVVTKASNVRVGSKLAVAPVGSTVVQNGEEITVQKTAVGGVMSEGIFCDSKMLGWGSTVGVAQLIPDNIPVGDPPPPSKPRPGGEEEQSSESSAPAVDVKPLFEKKLTKEEKKRLAEEKRKARKAAKEAKKAGEEIS